MGRVGEVGCYLSATAAPVTGTPMHQYPTGTQTEALMHSGTNEVQWKKVTAQNGSGAQQ